MPTLWALLLQLDRLGGCDVSSVRYLTNAAAAMPSSFVTPLRTAFPGPRLFLMHGQTEIRTTFLPPDQLDVRPGSVGRGMSGVELSLEDEHGVRLPPGNVGEMIVRGEGVMVGYWNNTATSATAVRPGRHPRERELRTHDLFRTDAEGWFSFVARTDDIIKSRGEKVSPAEIEDLLYTLEGVREARVIGVPDDVLGQAIRARSCSGRTPPWTRPRSSATCAASSNRSRSRSRSPSLPRCPKRSAGRSLAPLDGQRKTSPCIRVHHSPNSRPMVSSPSTMRCTSAVSAEWTVTNSLRCT